MRTEISYQTYDVNIDTTGAATFTVDDTVDLGQAQRLAEAHAAEQAGPDVSVDLTAVALPDGRELVDEWEGAYADEL
jgi:hypothetical protein